MAKMKNGRISGLIGPVVAVPMEDESILRMAPRKRSKGSWSPKQVLARKRLGSVTIFWKQFKGTPVQKIWKIADKGKRGINLFIKINMPAFGPAGDLMDEHRLHFSAGSIPLPHLLTASRSKEDPSKLEVSWDNHPEPGFSREDDELLVMTVKGGKYSGPVHTGVFRKTGSAVLQLPPGLENEVAVWLSFGNESRGMYSVDEYFKL